MYTMVEYRTTAVECRSVVYCRSILHRPKVLVARSVSRPELRTRPTAQLQLRNRPPLRAVGAMRHMQDAIQAASELSALGGDASAASADPDAPENPADAIARTEALARALGHIQRADAAGRVTQAPEALLISSPRR